MFLEKVFGRYHLATSRVSYHLQSVIALFPNWFAAVIDRWNNKRLARWNNRGLARNNAGCTDAGCSNAGSALPELGRYGQSESWSLAGVHLQLGGWLLI
jgi:hypothetical protein